MESVSNKDRLLARIISDAEADAEETLRKARQDASEIEAEYSKKISELEADHGKKREQAIASVMDGNRTRAALDGRKADLSSRRELIDRVFELAYQRLVALDGQKRERLLEKLLKSEAENGDTVIPSKADRERLSKLVKDFEPALSLSDKDAAIDAGFILAGDSYEKDCSFKAVLSQLRLSEETAVAEKLLS
ncbi:MAG: V-type ATP synthase subunit E family protein [Clostridia bacterium]|nr:V-type ATP synthase subunit E family protein [Clostridia bacterium]